MKSRIVVAREVSMAARDGCHMCNLIIHRATVKQANRLTSAQKHEVEIDEQRLVLRLNIDRVYFGFFMSGNTFPLPVFLGEGCYQFPYCG